MAGDRSSHQVSKPMDIEGATGCDPASSDPPHGASDTYSRQGAGEKDGSNDTFDCQGRTEARRPWLPSLAALLARPRIAANYDGHDRNTEAADLPGGSDDALGHQRAEEAAGFGPPKGADLTSDSNDTFHLQNTAQEAGRAHPTRANPRDGFDKEQPQSSQTETLQPPRQPAPGVACPPTDALRSAAAEALAEARARSHTADSADEVDVGQAVGRQSQAAEAGRDASEDWAEARSLDGRPASSAAGAPKAAAGAAAPSGAALDGRGAMVSLEIEEQAAYVEVSITELSAFAAYEADAARRDGAAPEALRAAWDWLPPEDKAALVPRQPRRELAMDKKWAPLLSRNTADQLEAWGALDIPLSIRRPWQVCADALEERSVTP
ncbi:unnamed protein product [Prorocentrum cordatum]|uniref:Rab3 GTPase-activating protein catalytic subunit n=1 Tax=Prorocentrum cordatum TaxID=2364126 RepID=A0ABN9PGD6_9DINO|nr:unnamed protein product [Polarella glacialis]